MQYKKSVKSNKKAYFAPLPPKSSHFCRSSPSLSTHRQCAPFLSIANNIAAVYQKKGNKTEYLAAPIVEGDG